MATLLLSLAGQALGTALGSPALGVIGRAVGAVAGNAFDRTLFGDSKVVEGPRLSDLEVQASSEGAPIPRVYGRARLAGQIIWATRFEEVAETVSGGGGKGGGGSAQTGVSYSYFANLAIGICEGPIARIGRIWADGELLDLTGIVHRVYTGDESQMPDSLIEAKQAAVVPAYRGLAYVVFERLPIGRFGNRIPQFTFEVIRVLEGLETRIRAITMIPGASEFGYQPQALSRTVTAGTSEPENAHSGSGASDWTTALDELQAVCPNLDRVALVVTWFGSDLRVDRCLVRPAVENRDKTVDGAQWRVAGIDRATATLVSTYQGRPAFGGTPSDDSVIAAIQDLKARGLKVMLYPFIMMDIPAANGLTDPWTGAADQPAYPWRGDITCDPAPGRPGTADKTPAAATQIAAFVGNAAPADYAIENGSLLYSGPDEWTLRRMILHYAHLCTLAGGVDSFLIASELVSLTRLRSDPGSYPFVADLVALAVDVRSVLDASTEISYGADWSEYFGHHPQDGTGDVYFHLDPLWSSPAIDFIGIDNYMPLSDWRDGDDHADAAIAGSPYEREYLQGHIAGGEGFDWYYADDVARTGQLRTPITDGTHGKPWVFRYKDLVNWWSNFHHDRPLGVESGQATAWAPRSKPIRFTEIGCPAVDKGANQPNVFPDPKSSASALPYFSSGARDDEAQRAFLDAVLRYWDPDDPDYDPARNPGSEIYGSTMVDPASLFVWTWDARPFPAFPHLDEIWSDGTNWTTGHWLTGRLGAAPLSALIAAILEENGIGDFDVSAVRGVIDGYVIDRPMSAREAIEPLLGAGLVQAADTGTRIRFFSPGKPAEITFSEDDLVEIPNRPLIQIRRAQETELPLRLTVGFTGDLIDFRRAAVSSRRLAGSSRREARIDLAAMMDYHLARRAADHRLHELWLGREVFSFTLPPSAIALEPGDVLRLDRSGTERTLQVRRIEEAGRISIEAGVSERSLQTPAVQAARRQHMRRPVVYGKPAARLLDLPLIAGDEAGFGARLAAFADPWPGRLAVFRTSSAESFSLLQTVERRAVIGRISAPLAAGRLAVWDRVNRITVNLDGGTLSGSTDELVKAGANLAAIGAEASGWEIVQFRDAELIGDNSYRLSWLLRGQAGTEDVMRAGHPAGATFVLLDAAAEDLLLGREEIGRPLTYRLGPAGRAISDPAYLELTATIAGRGFLPLSPVHLKARRDPATGDVTLAWTRRTRIGGDSWQQVDVPLGEEREAYDVLIYDGASVRRTLSVFEPRAVYTAAEQIADFGAAPAMIDFAVHQLSATHGRGIPRRATLQL